MAEGEPLPIRYIKLEPGEAVVISATQPDLGTRFPDLFERLRALIRKSAGSGANALTGDLSYKDDFDADHGREIAKLGQRLHRAGFPVDTVSYEVRNTLQHEPHRNIDGRLVEDLTGFFVDKLSYAPKETI